MKITQLKINSFRGIDDLTLKFNPDEPTVIMGVNGVGKSSILYCLSYFIISFLEKVVEKFQEKILIDRTEYSVIKLLDTNINSLFMNAEDVKEGKTECKIEMKLKKVMKFNNLLWKIEFDKKELVAQDYNADIKEAVKQVYDEIRENPDTNFPIFVYSPVQRTISDFSLELDDEHQSFHQFYAYENATDGLKFTTFLRWIRFIEDLENEEIRDNPQYKDKRLQAVREAVYSLIPEFSNLRVRRAPPRMTVNKKVGETTEELSIDQLSEGEKCLLAMVGDIARRLAIANPSLDDPLQGEGIILIDEIELHLHPQWQRKIIPALTRTFPNCQFIVTTHSPQVASHVQPENIYILKSTPEGIKAFKPEASFGRDSNQILEDLMDTPSRPQEIKDQLSELFRLVADNKLEEAIKLYDTISEEIGEDEPALVRASVAITRQEILKGAIH